MTKKTCTHTYSIYVMGIDEPIVYSSESTGILDMMKQGAPYISFMFEGCTTYIATKYIMNIVDCVECTSTEVSDDTCVVEEGPKNG